MKAVGFRSAEGSPALLDAFGGPADTKSSMSSCSGSMLSSSDY